MPTRADYFRRPSGQTLYAKPLPLVLAPWAADALAGSENGATGSYAFTELADGRSYEVFCQLGATPEPSDVAVGMFPQPVDSPGMRVLLDRVTGLTGPYIASITIQDEGGLPVEPARVRLTKLGDTQSRFTDATGLAEFACEPGTWSLAVTAPGFASQYHSLVVTDDTQVIYTLLAITVSEPASPALCVVQIFARHNSIELEGAVCKARLKSANSTVDGAVLSTQITESVTNASGYAELQLIRLSEFVDGDGEYVIEVWHADRRIVSAAVTIPDQEFINLEDLITSAGGA